MNLDLKGKSVLVNNASTAVSGNIETLDDDGLMERLTGKTLAYMRCCRAALPHLRKSGRGRAICIAVDGPRAGGYDRDPTVRPRDQHARVRARHGRNSSNQRRPRFLER